MMGSCVIVGLRRLKTALRIALRDVVVNGIAQSVLVPRQVRGLILRPFGIRLGRARMEGRGFIGTGRLCVGSGSYLNYGCFLDPSAGITIGERVSIGPECMFITSSHDIGSTRDSRTSRLPGTEVKAGIVVESDVWLGARVTILPGVRIGAGCVVGAGAVVVSDCDSDGLYVGVPARRVKDLQLVSPI